MTATDQNWGWYLQQLNGLGVLLLPAELGHLDQDWPGMTRVLRLKTRR